ncbi:MAG TPA: hypothetical protein VEY89_00855 [Candidatus Dormibacteraeota bacterium]|nr:hypothetical protein [Candidatus Dormibacteraeota bacterium]
MDRGDRLIILAIFLALGASKPAAVPVAPAATSSLLGRITAVLVWGAANLVLWLVLFGWPALAELPVILRLVAGIFANFYLIRVARGAGERVGRRGAQPGAADSTP